MKKQLIAMGTLLVLAISALPSSAACPCRFQSYYPSQSAPCCSTPVVAPCCPAAPVINSCCPACPCAKPACPSCCPAKPCCEPMSCPCPAAPIQPCNTCDDPCD